MHRDGPEAHRSGRPVPRPARTPLAADAARFAAAGGAARLDPGAAAALQRAVGNAAFAAAVQRSAERDAHTHGPGCGHGEAVQRSAERDAHTHGAGCGHQEAVQRSTVPDVLRSAGRPLEDSVRADMESRLGADFSDVRVHDDAAARASAEEVGARAYTSGAHVVIGDGGGDRHTLAHELTHVIQQRQGPVAGTDSGDGLKVSDPSDRFEREAEANATRVLSGPAPATAAEPVQRAARRPARSASALSWADPIQRACASCANPNCTNKSLCKFGTPTYQVGTHGNKKKEQNRLTQLYGATVNGNTHESEHVIGYEPLSQTSGLTRGGSSAARQLENRAHAYQEVAPFHRAHIGTGTTGTADASGLNSHDYRAQQRALMVSGDISSAVQLNQLGYAHLPGFQNQAATPALQQANDSYNAMVGSMHSTGVTYAGPAAHTTVGVDWRQQAEMHAARLMAQGRSLDEARHEAYRRYNPDYEG
ncbi:eCIS core domain-containing protein [Streptomyces tanashiensis]|uniref:eCIS core domain-containing protein n=1 Tax=Streptomyces tanashiensis TaxID=67367 RepID=UPI003F4DB62B